MKFTLNEYQDDAVGEVLDRLKKARKRWREDRDKHAFALTATTGAGKTVMAAAVLEALFHGDDDNDFEPDPGAVVIWFSDDPSLNVQSSWRLKEASDKLTVSDLVTVGNSFTREKFDPGKIYFLNTQKLSKNSLLVRGHSSNDAELETDAYQNRIMPDARSYTIWDTIENTIKDPNLTLYLILDEAHRGMKEGGRSEKPTIVKQLINGSGTVPGIPIVWGISATVQRFDEAISGMQGHSKMPNVEVNAGRVQASGLLKDTIDIDIPNETGDLATVLLRRGTDKLKEVSDAWAKYALQQSDADVVQPLLVVQVPNTPDPELITKWLDVIFYRWPDLPPDCVANVFGEHKPETYGRYFVAYIEPERVQESTWIRILLAKDAISTGWDCPRAEVMVSFRAAYDRTHITQLLGRMVRTPLARRIPGNDRLNAVDCLLPYFDKKTVKEVVDSLMTGSEGGDRIPGRRVLVNAREMHPNPRVPEIVWEKLGELPSQTLPRKQAQPIKRLTALAHEFAADDVMPDAGKRAHAEMHKVLDGLKARYADEIVKKREDVLSVEGTTARANWNSNNLTFNDFVEAADYNVIEDAYKRAARIISPDLATTYSDRLADLDFHNEDIEGSLLEAHTTIAAIGLVPDVKDQIESAANKLSDKWLNQHRIAIKGLTDERQEVYRQLKAMSANPMDIDVARPHVWLQATKENEADGKEVELPCFEKHLLCDENGLFPERFNEWEKKVLAIELSRPENIAWYRNPARASQDSLGVVYEDAGEKKILRPDFIFFSKIGDGNIAVDIVDPHGIQFSDAVPKLRGLAKYAEKNRGVFRRVEVVAEVAGAYRFLDLTEVSVREAIWSATSARALYESSVAAEYIG